MIIKEYIQHENMSTLNIYASNNRTSSRKIELKREN
jgi:hypothetical protein